MQRKRGRGREKGKSEITQRVTVLGRPKTYGEKKPRGKYPSYRKPKEPERDEGGGFKKNKGSGGKRKKRREWEELKIAWQRRQVAQPTLQTVVVFWSKRETGGKKEEKKRGQGEGRRLYW